MLIIDPGGLISFGHELTSPDDCQFLLRHRFHAHLQHGNYHADRIHAEEVFGGRGAEQLHAKHLLLRRFVPHSPDHQCHWQWLAVYYPWPAGTGKQFGHILHEGVWSPLATEDGRACALNCVGLWKVHFLRRFSVPYVLFEGSGSGSIKRYQSLLSRTLSLLVFWAMHLYPCSFFLSSGLSALFDDTLTRNKHSYQSSSN